MRRRVAKIDRIAQWQRQGAKHRDSINKAKALIKGLDREISSIGRERKLRQLEEDKADSAADVENIIKDAHLIHQETLADRDETQESESVTGYRNFLDQKPFLFNEPSLSIPVPSDSGYRSGYGSDTESVCSMKSITSSLNIPHDLLQDFIASFVTALIKRSGARAWAEYSMAHYSLKEIESQLDALLKEYSMNLALLSTSPEMQNNGRAGHSQNSLASASKFVRLHKSRITRYFCENVQSVPLSTTSLHDLSHSSGQHLSLAERIELSTRSVSTYEDPLEVSLEEPADDDIADLRQIRDQLLSNDAFSLLAINIRRTLYCDDKIEMKSIETIMQEDTLFRPITGAYEATFSVNWSMKHLTQPPNSKIVPRIDSTVVITGSTFYAQATTCAEYVTATWPESGTFFLRFLKYIQREGVQHTNAVREVTIQDSSEQSLLIEAKIYESNIAISAYATEEKPLVELAQQLAWSGCAFRASPYGDQPAYFKPLFLKKGPRAFKIIFKHSPIHFTETACWLQLFCGAVIVAGFPVPDRAEEIGLEISLELLAWLSGVRHAVEYEGGVVVKGFSHLFVPIQKSADRVQWHAIMSQNPDKRMSIHDGLSRCTSRATLQEVSLREIATLRAIVGWCSVAETNLGSDSANYENIDYSKTVDAESGVQCSGGTLGFQQFGVASIEFRNGCKDWKCYFQRKGTFQKIVRIAENTPIALYDTGEERAWLVPASEVMLHIIQHRYQLGHFK